MPVESVDVTVSRLRDVVRDAGGIGADYAESDFSHESELAAWLRSCAEKLLEGDFVSAPMVQGPDTLYLALNEIAFNPAEWHFVPMAFAHANRTEEIEISEEFDSLVGHEAADIKSQRAILKGLEGLQGAMLQGAAIQRPTDQLVVALAMALVDRALALAGDIGVRVALSRSDEPVIALWEHSSKGWHGVIHDEFGEWS